MIFIMVKIKRLLENQNIIIDDHKRGAGTPINWNNPHSDIHIHKETINNDNGKYIIRIPLNSNRKVSMEYYHKHSISNKIPKKIIKEISTILNDENIRTVFFEDIYKTINDFNWDRSEESEKHILKKVADAFDIPIQRWEKLENSEKRSFVHLSKSEEKFFHIVLNYTQSKLIVGEFAVCNQTGIPKEILGTKSPSITSR